MPSGPMISVTTRRLVLRYFTIQVLHDMRGSPIRSKENFIYQGPLIGTFSSSEAPSDGFYFRIALSHIVLVVAFLGCVVAIE